MNEDRLDVPPQALTAEMAVLGSMMIEGEAAEKAIEGLEEKDFYRRRHRLIFERARGLVAKRQAVDRVTISEALKTDNVFDEAGGSPYLSELLSTVSSAGHVDHYIDIVKEKSIVRQLMTVSTEVIADCRAENDDAGGLLDTAQTKIMAVAQKRAASGFHHIEPISQRVITHMRECSKKPGGVTGVPSGFKALDRLTLGFQKGDLILIAARPSQGKTALALNIAAHVAVEADPPRSVALFSLEMAEDLITERMIASMARVNLQTIRSGYFQRSRWADLTTAAARMGEAPIYIDDSSALSILDVRGRARRLARELEGKGRELGIIIIDYLQLMRGPTKRPESRQQEVSEISRGLKAMARDLKVPVVALAQLNRRVEDRSGAAGRPQLSDLRESGSLEQDADLAIFIHHPAKPDPGDPNPALEAQLIIAKNRNGPVGAVNMIFRKDLTRFEDMEPRDEEPAEEVEIQFI